MVVSWYTYVVLVVFFFFFFPPITTQLYSTTYEYNRWPTVFYVYGITLKTAVITSRCNGITALRFRFSKYFIGYLICFRFVHCQNKTKTPQKKRVNFARDYRRNRRKYTYTPYVFLCFDLQPNFDLSRPVTITTSLVSGRIPSYT